MQFVLSWELGQTRGRAGQDRDHTARGCSEGNLWGHPPCPLPSPAWDTLTSPSVVLMSSTVGS